MTMTFNDDDERSSLVNQLSDGAREGFEEGAGRDEWTQRAAAGWAVRVSLPNMLHPSCCRSRQSIIVGGGATNVSNYGATSEEGGRRWGNAHRFLLGLSMRMEWSWSSGHREHVRWMILVGIFAALGRMDWRSARARIDVKTGGISGLWLFVWCCCAPEGVSGMGSEGVICLFSLERVVTEMERNIHRNLVFCNNDIK